jgi:hypothetical protein
MKKTYIIAAGIINLFSAILHLVGGQIELVNPLLNSNISIQQKGELTGAWHIVSILLFFTAFIILNVGFKHKTQKKELLKTIAFLYLLSGLPFIVVSYWYNIYALQWVLLIPIGVILMLGLQKPNRKETL